MQAHSLRLMGLVLACLHHRKLRKLTSDFDVMPRPLQISLNDTADEHILEVAWTCGAQRAELLCDLKAMSFQARRLVLFLGAMVSRGFLLPGVSANQLDESARLVCGR